MAESLVPNYWSASRSLPTAAFGRRRAMCPSYAKGRSKPGAERDDSGMQPARRSRHLASGMIQKTNPWGSVSSGTGSMVSTAICPSVMSWSRAHAVRP
jgi:hypothetical protein